MTRNKLLRRVMKQMQRTLSKNFQAVTILAVVSAGVNCQEAKNNALQLRAH